jgi:hypothetical protein
LAECLVGRRIIAEHNTVDGYCCPRCHGDKIIYDEGPDGRQVMVSEGIVEYPCATLRALAIPYGEHPDMRLEWWSVIA